MDGVRELLGTAIEFVAVLLLILLFFLAALACIYVLFFVGHRLALRLLRRKSQIAQRVFSALALVMFLIALTSGIVHIYRFPDAPQSPDSRHSYAINERGDVRYFSLSGYLLSPRVVFPVAVLLIFSGCLLANWARQAGDPAYRLPGFWDVFRKFRRIRSNAKGRVS